SHHQELAVDEVSITRYITDTFDGVDVVVASRETGAPEVAWGDTFFSYDPDRDLEPKHRMPFATIVTKDYGDFDRASNLNRPGVFRLNIGVSKDTCCLAPGGKVTEYRVAEDSDPFLIIAGPDGNMWFTDEKDRIGHIRIRTGEKLPKKK